MGENMVERGSVCVAFSGLDSDMASSKGSVERQSVLKRDSVLLLKRDSVFVPFPGPSKIGTLAPLGWEADGGAAGGGGAHAQVCTCSWVAFVCVCQCYWGVFVCMSHQVVGNMYQWHVTSYQ